ncbi:MAG TPA: hypothetical protein VLA24_09385 [Pseudomonadales bacterium]|nr:hypothetical protein [Pseudomonadales bacterium]
MTNTITKHQSVITSLDDLQRVAKIYAASGYFDAKGDSAQAIAQIATKIMAGQELGYGPFTSANGIQVIQGRPALSANLMAAAIKGHPHYNYKVREMTDANVSLEFFYDDESLGLSPFSIADARRAGTKNLDKFPRNMLFARAISNGVKWYCPDVFSGNAVYTPEELGANVDEEGEYISMQQHLHDTPANPDKTIKPTPETPPTNDDVDKNDATADESAIIAQWMAADNKAKAAQEWAVEIGAQPNEHAARNSMKKIVDTNHEGKFTNANMEEVLTEYYFRQQEKLAAVPDDVPVDDAEPIEA